MQENKSALHLLRQDLQKEVKKINALIPLAEEDQLKLVKEELQKIKEIIL
jgi:ribosome recycling factor